MAEMTTSPSITCMHDCYVTPAWYDLTQLAVIVALALITRRWRFVPVSAALAVLVIGFVMPSTVYGLPDESGFGAPRLLSGQYALTYYAVTLAAVAIVFGIKRSIIWVSNRQGRRALGASSDAVDGSAARPKQGDHPPKR